MKKIKTKVVVDEIINSDKVFKTNHIFKYGKNTLEVIFIDNTEYEESLVNQVKGSLYLYDEKGIHHLLLIRRKDYEVTFKELYTPDMILSNLKLYVNRRKTLNFGRGSFILTIILLIIVNLIFIIEYGFDKVFYIPVISVIIGFIIFTVYSKVMMRNYLDEKHEMQEEQLAKNPRIKTLIEEEKRIAEIRKEKL